VQKVLFILKPGMCYWYNSVACSLKLRVNKDILYNLSKTIYGRLWLVYVVTLITSMLQKHEQGIIPVGWKY
jgi:hypothetical protein